MSHEDIRKLPDYWKREYLERVQRLAVRGMSQRAAQIVVDAAMFGYGCLEGEVRARQEGKREREST